MSKAIIHKSCDTLPLSAFIRCIVDNDLTALLVKGSPTVEELSEAWANIYAEYLDLNEDNEAKYLLKLQTEITVLRYHVTKITNVLAVLHIVYHPDLITVLHESDYDLPLDPSNEKQYYQSLKHIENSISADALQLEMKEQELTEYVRSRTGESIDRNYFTRMIIRVSKFMGYGIRAKDITVAEFLSIIKEMLAYKKASTKKQADVNEG